MPGHFHPRTNTILRLAILTIAALAAFAAWAGAMFVRSPYQTREGVPRDQPVPFSHEHHVGGLGIDCRFCHTNVETSNYAGMPPTETCMNCHSQLWAVAPILEPVRESYRTGSSIPWTRVYDLPDFVYFNHSIHINKGVGCSTCHGRVDRMPLTWKASPLTMEWCLDCHRNPIKNIRPLDRVFDMEWEPSPGQMASARQVERIKRKGFQPLTNCSICHR